MKNKKKWLLVGLFAVVLAVAALVGYKVTRPDTEDGTKKFTLVVQSERDSFEKSVECKSDMATLGEYVRTLDYCEWEESEYGVYITGWYEYQQDLDNQYWWSININGEQSGSGADLIPLKDGDSYEFVLVQGW